MTSCCAECYTVAYSARTTRACVALTLAVAVVREEAVPAAAAGHFGLIAKTQLVGLGNH